MEAADDECVFFPLTFLGRANALTVQACKVFAFAYPVSFRLRSVVNAKSGKIWGGENMRKFSEVRQTCSQSTDVQFADVKREKAVNSR